MFSREVTPKPEQVQLPAEELAREVSLGDTVIRYPQTFGSGAGMPGGRMLRGRVTYIHPRKRYHMVDFPIKRGHVIRECFIGVRFHTLKGGQS